MIDSVKNKIKSIVFGIKKKLIMNQETIDKFHRLYYDAGIVQFTEWEGVRIYKYPSDLFLYQEIIFKNKPDVIIETGTLYGGSALYFARLLDILGHGEVVSIDISKKDFPKHPRIEYITESSVDPALLAKLMDKYEGKKVMVILDSDHHREHVREELKLYSSLVSKGQYLIVEDGDINNHPVYPSFGPGPFEAIEDFLKVSDDFEVDKKLENKYLFSAAVNGFLRKVN